LIGILLTALRTNQIVITPIFDRLTADLAGQLNILGADFSAKSAIVNHKFYGYFS
jgi:hypothetical protein